MAHFVLAVSLGAIVASGILVSYSIGKSDAATEWSQAAKRLNDAAQRANDVSEKYRDLNVTIGRQRDEAISLAQRCSDGR